MARSAYNYTLVEEYKQKLVIPYTGLEFEGWAMIIASVLGIITGTLVLGRILSLFMGMNGYFMAFLPSFFITFVIVKMSEEKDENLGRTKFQKFYYGVIKKYNVVHDRNGITHYIAKKREGVMFIVCRKNVD